MLVAVHLYVYPPIHYSLKMLKTVALKVSLFSLFPCVPILFLLLFKLFFCKHECQYNKVQTQSPIIFAE